MVTQKPTAAVPETIELGRGLFYKDFLNTGDMCEFIKTIGQENCEGVANFGLKKNGTQSFRLFYRDPNYKPKRSIGPTQELPGGKK